MRIKTEDIILYSLSEDTKHFPIPAFTKKENNKERAGQLGRFCTGQFKIKSIRREIRKIFGLKKRYTQIGYSMDEIKRRNDSRFPKYITPRYPLLEMKMTRKDCILWLNDNNCKIPIVSSCIICPFQKDSQWNYLKQNEPDEFQKAAQFDEDIRHLGKKESIEAIDGQKSFFDIDPNSIPERSLYLHPSGLPLKEVVFKNSDDNEDEDIIGEYSCGSFCSI